MCHLKNLSTGENVVLQRFQDNKKSSLKYLINIKNIYIELRQQENPKKSVDNFALIKRTGLIYPPI